MSYKHYTILLAVIFLSMAGSGPAAAWISSAREPADTPDSDPPAVSKTSPTTQTERTPVQQKISPTPYPLANEQIVNSETSGEQDFPSIAALGPNRGFVVVWQSEGSSGTTRIHGQRYDQHGAPVVASPGLPYEFPVSPTSTGADTYPSVAALSGGGFVVTWTSTVSGVTSIYGQRYDSAGEPLGPVFQVSPTGNTHRFSAVAGLANGYFVVTWTSDMAGTVTNIHGQIFNPDGIKVGATAFRVNTLGSPDYSQENSAVTALASGGFVATWQSDDHTAGQWNIYMKLFDGHGGEKSGNILVNTIAPGTELSDGDDLNPSVAALSKGRFVVAWSDVGNESVQGKRYDANGTTIPHPDTILDDFKIGDQAHNTFLHNDVTGISDGGFVVTWVQLGPLTSNIYGQRFNRDGVAIGGRFGVNDPGANPGKNERFPRVVELGDGTIAFVWVGVDFTSSGTVSSGVFSRLFALATPSPEV